MGAAHASSSRCWSPPCCVWLISRREASEPQLCRLLLCISLYGGLDFSGSVCGWCVRMLWAPQLQLRSGQLSRQKHINCPASHRDYCFHSRVDWQMNYNRLSCIYHIYLFCLFLCHCRNSSAIQAQFLLTTDGFAPLLLMCGGDERWVITFQISKVSKISKVPQG